MKFINTFFLDSQTKMNPNMNYGQVVRGPGKTSGTFTGILDLRGTVKIVNAILIIQALNCSDWTEENRAEVRNWMAQYSEWMQTSSLGQSTASRPK